MIHDREYEAFELNNHRKALIALLIPFITAFFALDYERFKKNYFSFLLYLLVHPALEGKEASDNIFTMLEPSSKQLSKRERDVEMQTRFD